MRSMENPVKKVNHPRVSKNRILTHERRMKIVSAAIQGQSITQAAIDAGYSPKTADKQASAILANDRVKESFARILEESGLTENFLAAKVSELVNAKTTIYAQREGVFTDERTLPALETQRKTLELVCRIRGYLQETNTSTINNSGLMQIVVAQLSQGK